MPEETFPNKAYSMARSQITKKYATKPQKWLDWYLRKATGGVFFKKLYLKISQYLHESTCVGVSF